LDGKIALANGESEWITGEKSRAAGRQLRAAHDAIAVGANTACLDNPQLTTRITGEADPIRIVFDSGLRLSLSSNLALTARETPVWIFTSASSGPAYEGLKALGVRLITIGNLAGGLDLSGALQILADNQVQTLLVEGGGTLAASFLRLGAVDVIEWFRAPIILGGDGRSGVGDLGLGSLDFAHSFRRIETAELGDDLHERYEQIHGAGDS
jgi:diaminohydroxyphosphoribosylaminopyrimidine deaminase/5-amino-6-(5-phosphoribosylamino)uracil reductase